MIFYFDPPLLLDRIVGFRHSGGDVDVDIAIVFPACIAYVIIDKVNPEA